MNYPALKGRVSINKKMLRQIEPRLRRSNVMLNSFSSCISNASKELAWTPKMPFSEIFSQPRMFLQKSESRSPFKQLQSFTNTHCRWKFNKQMDMVNSNMEFVDFASMFDSNFCDESFYINSNTIELHGISSVFRFPNKVERILPESMAKGFQFHFLSPQTFIRSKVLTMFVNLVQEGKIYPSFINNSQELNLMEVGSPPKLKSKGIRARAM